MAFPNYVPPENPQRLGKVILFHRFLNAIRSADNQITSWIILTPQGEFKIIPYFTDNDDNNRDDSLLQESVHKTLLSAESNFLGPQAAEAQDEMRPLFYIFLEQWRSHRRLILRKNRKKELITLI